jgi:hypothetical protein
MASWMNVGLMLRQIFLAPAPLFAPILVAKQAFLLEVPLQILVRGELARAPLARYVTFSDVPFSFFSRGEAFAIFAEESIPRLVESYSSFSFGAFVAVSAFVYYWGWFS